MNKRIRLIGVKRRAQREAKAILDERTKLMEGLEFLNFIRMNRGGQL